MKRLMPIAILAFTIGLIFLLGRIDETQLEMFVRSWGSFAVVAICATILITQVFAPLSGAPVMFIGFRIIGFEKTMVLFYLVSILSAIINFGIARKLGRRWIIKFIGVDCLLEVDRIAKSEEKFLLVWSRVFGYYIFDVISYAIGATNVSFKKYITSTAVFTLIPWGCYFIAFRFVDMKSTAGMLAYFVSLLVTAGIFGRLFWKIRSSYIEHKVKDGNPE